MHTTSTRIALALGFLVSSASVAAAQSQEIYSDMLWRSIGRTHRAGEDHHGGSGAEPAQVSPRAGCTPRAEPGPWPHFARHARSNRSIREGKTMSLRTGSMTAM